MYGCLDAERASSDAVMRPPDRDRRGALGPPDLLRSHSDNVMTTCHDAAAAAAAAAAAEKLQRDRHETHGAARCTAACLAVRPTC